MKNDQYIVQRLLRIIGMLICIGLYWLAGNLCSLAVWIEKREG